jgi:uncharacterized protein
MTTNEKELLSQLFEKIRKVSQDSPPIDPDARQSIEEELSKVPNAPYFMAQTIIMQQGALREAEKNIDRENQPVNSPNHINSIQPRQYGYPSGGGGFLAGAAQTAIGIAGGILLANAAMSIVDNLTNENEANDNFFEDEPGAHAEDSDGLNDADSIEGSSDDAGDIGGEDSSDFGGDDFGGFDGGDFG